VCILSLHILRVELISLGYVHLSKAGCLYLAVAIPEGADVQCNIQSGVVTLQGKSQGEEDENVS
jgi:hypothetical protein